MPRRDLDSSSSSPLGDSEAADGDGVLATINRIACLALLTTRPFGRLVFTHGALPDVLPVNYRMDGESLLIRLSSGSAAAAGTRGSVVAFEVDEIDEPAQTGWSVTVVGQALEITNVEELARVQTLGLSSWVQDHRDHVVRIAADRVTGRRLLRAGGSSGEPVRGPVTTASAAVVSPAVPADRAGRGNVAAPP